MKVKVTRIGKGFRIETHHGSDVLPKDCLKLLWPHLGYEDEPHVGSQVDLEVSLTRPYWTNRYATINHSTGDRWHCVSGLRDLSYILVCYSGLLRLMALEYEPGELYIVMPKQVAQASNNVECFTLG